MSHGRVASDPSVGDYADTSPASLGRRMKVRALIFLPLRPGRQDLPGEVDEGTGEPPPQVDKPGAAA